MKPAFALSFSENGISLHHLSDGDWYCLGTVLQHAPDLQLQMQALRDQGIALENDLSCKLIIPSDQVRLLTVETEGLKSDATVRKIEATLASSTPYGLAELAYVTTPDGTDTHVAAVARQTLDKARAFAVDHGFFPEAFWISATGKDALSEPSFEFPAAPAEYAPSVVTRAPKSETPETASAPEIPVHVIAGEAETPAIEPAPIALAPTSTSVSDLRRFAIPAVAASVLSGMVMGVWLFYSSEPEVPVVEPKVAIVEPKVPIVELEVAKPIVAEPQSEPENVTVEQEPQGIEIASAPPNLEEPEPVTEYKPTLSFPDAAILEALKVEPVEEMFYQPEATTKIRDFIGSAPVEPSDLSAPPEPHVAEIYLTSVDRSNLFADLVALPPFFGLNTDEPIVPIAVPRPVGHLFELDKRGIITSSTDETLNPAGVMVNLERPSWVPPEPPPRFETEPVIEEEVNDRFIAIHPRPGNLVDQFERQQLDDQFQKETAAIRPKLRPESLQVKPQVDETPATLAVLRVPRPRIRPAGIAAQAAKKPGSGSAKLESTINVATSTDEAGSFRPKTVKPKIPTTASVARQATIDNAINLRKLNLIGVYGTPANRRALVRLPSGRYKKLEVGDRIDGGKVIAIGDSELRYQKRGKNVTLKMPRR